MTSCSISGYCFSLGSGMISWSSHKHNHAANSSCYTEYISLHDASHEVLFLCQLLDGINMPDLAPTSISTFLPYYILLLLSVPSSQLVHLCLSIHGLALPTTFTRLPSRRSIPFFCLSFF